MTDVVLIVWLAIGATGLVASVMGARKWGSRQRSYKLRGLDGPRGFLVAGRLRLWQMYVVAFAMWFLAGLSAVVGTVATGTRPVVGIVFVLLVFGGFGMFAASVVVGRWYDDRLERML